MVLNPGCSQTPGQEAEIPVLPRHEFRVHAHPEIWVTGLLMPDFFAR